MNRCAGQSTTEFMLMVVILTIMAVMVRTRLWDPICHVTDQAMAVTAADGRITTQEAQ